MPTPTKRRKTLTNTAKDSLGKMTAQALLNIRAALDEGDVQASITVLSWIVPKPKPVNSEAFNIKGTIAGLTLPEQLQAINDAVLNGEVSMESADLVLGLLLKSKELLEITEFENRLAILEGHDAKTIIN